MPATAQDWLEELLDWDQALHFIWTGALAFYTGSIWWGLLAGATLVIPREFVDQRDTLRPEFPWIGNGKAVDIGVSMIGALVGGVLGSLFRG